MAFELTRITNGRVLHARIFGAMTDIDNATFDDAVRAELNDHAGLPVHLLLDYSGVERIQTHISPVSDALPAATLAKHPALGLRVAVKTPLLRFVPDFLSSALRPPAQQLGSLNEALAYLTDTDPTLRHKQPHAPVRRWRLPA